MLLGSVALHADGEPVPTRSVFLRTFLALLAVRPGRVLSNTHLIDELWGEGLPQDPRAALQVQATRLRKWLVAGGLAPATLRNEQDGYLLDVPPEAVDLLAFLAAATRAGSVSAGGPATALRASDEALALWGGEPFVGCVQALDLESERVRASEHFLQLIERRCQALVDLGEYEAALADLGFHLPRHRAREGLTALMMLALYRAGRQSEALAVFAETRRHLIEEHGLEPGPGLVRLEAQVLQQSGDLDAPGGRVATAPIEATRVRARPMIVGRATELALVGRRLREREGSVLLATGEAGVGKTTLVTAAAHEAGSLGALVGFGAFDDDAAPLAAWEEALGDLGVDSGATAGDRSHVLAGRAVRAVLANLAREAAVLVVLEDLHLADSRSLGILRHLVRVGVPPGTVVLGSARDPDVVDHPAWAAAHADLARQPGVSELHLSKLDAASAEELVRLRLSGLGRELTPRLLDALVERSSGHPLHLAALLDAVADRPDERSCLVAAEEVPSSLRPLLAHQVAALPHSCRQLLEVMAIVGPASVEALAAATGRGIPDVTEGLRPALDTGVVRESGDDLALSHALTAQAVSESTPRATRLRLHHARYSVLVGAGGDPFAVLRHAVGSGSLVPPADVARARLAAAGVAYGRGAHAEAAELAEQAEPDIPDDLVPLVALQRGLALAALGRSEEADDLLDGVVGASGVPVDVAITAAVGHEPLGLRVAGDQRRLARLQAVLARTTGTSERRRVEVLRALVLEESLAYGRVRTVAAQAELAALAATSAGTDRELDARLQLMAARDGVEGTDAQARLDAAEAAVALAAQVDDPILLLEANEFLLSATVAVGQLERSHDVRWALAYEAQRANRPRSIWAANIMAASLETAAGRMHEADRIAQQALDDGLRLGIPDALGAFGVHLVIRAWLDGRLAELTALVDQASADYPNIAAWPAVAAVACVNAGDARGARHRLSLFSSRRSIQATRYFDRPALCLAAAASLSLGDRDVAHLVRDALKDDGESVVVVGVGAGILGPVDLYRAMADCALGDFATAARHLDRARRRAADLGWPPWEEAAQRLEAALEDLAATGGGDSLPLGLRMLR